MKTAAKWSSFGEICAKLISPITNAILARLLVPEAFGVVATLTLVVSFAEIFTDAGFQKYLVQHEFKDEDDLELGTNVAFWTNLSLSLVLWVGIALLSTPIAGLVGSTGYEKAIILMSAEIPILAFSSIQTARYRRDFDFKSLFYAKITTAIIPLLVTVPLAFLFRDYKALVIGTLGKDIANAVILTLKSSWKPKLHYSIKKLKEMLSFSIWTIVENITVWLTLNADVFIVGSVLSSYYLGLYKTSVSTVNSFMNLITGAAMPVAFSALSRCQSDKIEFKNVFYRFQKTIALLVLPLGFGVFVYRETATDILLGSQWTEAANFLGMWALTSSVSIVFHNLNSESFRSIGKPKLSVLTQILHLVALIPVVLVSMSYGYEALTIARSLVRLEMIAVSSTIAYLSMGLNFFVSLKNVLPQLLSSIVMAAVGILIKDLCGGILWKVVTILICCVVYAVCMLLIPSGRSQLLGIIKERK